MTDLFARRTTAILLIALVFLMTAIAAITGLQLRDDQRDLGGQVAASASGPEGQAQGSGSDATPDTPEQIEARKAVNEGPAERAECGLNSASISGLLGPDVTDDNVSDRMRDAVLVLEEQLVDWEQAIEARPDFRTQINHARAVAKAWRDSLYAFDTGDHGSARDSLDAAARSLKAVDASRPRGCRR